MPSKGIKCYSYIAVPGCQIEFSVPKTTIVRNQLKTFVKDHLEVDKANIRGLFNFTGTFAFSVTQNGSAITTQSVSVNSLTGNLESGTMKSMPNQTAVIANSVIVSYGFYDAGPGQAGLPSQHQCYVSVSPHYGHWMSDIAPEGSPQSLQPFSRLALPAAHDIGMNSMQTADAVLSSPALVDALTYLTPAFANAAHTVSKPVVVQIAPAIVRGLAITQKDTLQTILSLGARYFEFRPAYLHNSIRNQPRLAIPNVLYFSHSAIPGMPYASFLQDCVSFLVGHPGEIIVTQNRWDGVPPECARPSDAELAQYLSEALAASNGGVVAGSLDDMLNLSITQLRQQRKRLIIFGPTDSYSTYTDEGNATLNGDSIIDQFNRIPPQIPPGKAFTNLQCQATATNLPNVVIYSVLAANVGSSCLLATKPICDSKTLPWIVANGGRVDSSRCAVVMNDFFDGATADVAIDWSRRRLG